MTTLNTPIALYVASVLGAVALVLVMPKQRANFRLLGALLGAGTLGGLWLLVAPRGDLEGTSWVAFLYYYVFSAIAIGAAARVITHTRPVYSALWFVMVVLASAGLLLTLAAEFMAFAMVIIYAGAILVTYMFVIMLATQSQSAEGGTTDATSDELSPVYDRLAREPVAATAAGFVLLAVLLGVSFQTDAIESNPAAWAPSEAVIAETILADRPLEPGTEELAEAEAGDDNVITAPRELSNVEGVGIDLFRSHPLGLELAGVILLVSLIGAVVIAKTQVRGEDRFPAMPDPSGATVHPTHEPGPGEAEAFGESGGRMGV